MKVARMVGIPVLAALAIAAATSLCAQSAGSGQVVTGTSGGLFLPGTVLPESVAPPAAPYSATRTTTRVQTLADGTTITHTNVQKEARDSVGRTYHAIQPQLGGLTGQKLDWTIYTVSDPVKRIMMHWTSNGKIVTVNHWPEPQKSHPLPVPQNNQAPAPVLPRVQRNSPDMQIDDLGTQNIDGILAHGRRITRVIPAGREGNNQQITVTTETWVSSELRTDVLLVSEDPRSGNTRTELSDIDLNEPDPSLFQAPEGYTLQEMEPVSPHTADTNPQ